MTNVLFVIDSMLFSTHLRCHVLLGKQVDALLKMRMTLANEHSLRESTRGQLTNGIYK